MSADLTLRNIDGTITLDLNSDDNDLRLDINEFNGVFQRIQERAELYKSAVSATIKVAEKIIDGEMSIDDATREAISRHSISSLTKTIIACIYNLRHNSGRKAGRAR